MRILFFGRHYGYFRNYESTILALLDRGHAVHLAVDREEILGGREMVQRWAAQRPALTFGWTPDREPDNWFWLSTRLRLALDFLRYQDARYDSARQLRQRAEERLPTVVLGALKLFGCRVTPIRRLAEALLGLLERAVPRDPRIDGFTADLAPDVVLITPLVELGSPQLDYLRAAQAAGKPTGVCVGSWDHLSSKARIRVWPDRVFVWNAVQQAEAIDLHGLPPERITVTGAQCFDRWFDRQPSRSRGTFCQAMGLPADRPFILWVGSSLFRGGRPEADLVETWIRHVRGSGRPGVEDAAILIRPHPQRADEWRWFDTGEFEHVACRSGNPVEAQGLADYFDAMYHCAAVVGVNTSALIEAAILGRPVLSIVHPEYARNQVETLHWPYLRSAGGGVLQVADGFDLHLDQLAKAMEKPEAGAARARGFLEVFVRPHGLESPATPRLVEGIEALAAVTVDSTASASPGWAVLVRPLLYVPILLRTLRRDLQLVRKRTRRSAGRSLEQAKRGLRIGVKRVVLKRLRSQGPPTVLTKPDKIRARAQTMFDKVEEVEETKEELARLARSSRPIIVGPWLSETGFELLYWIPFLQWVKSYRSFRDDRLIAVSRGGASSWYGHVTTNYQDVFDFFGPDEFRSRNDRRIAELGGLKHNRATDFDEEIIDRARVAAKLGEVDVLHPSMMYRLFRIFWRMQASVGLIQGFTRHRRMPAPPLGDLARHLPPDFVTVKFYGSNSFPDTPANRAFVVDYLSRLAAEHHVILLNTGVRFDDHDDFAPTTRDRIHVVDHLMNPRNNLDVQTRIIGASRAFVGTYGGFSYLAPFLGVDGVAFYSDASGFRVDHLEIAKRVFAELQVASFLPLDVSDLDVLRIAFGVADGLAVAAGPR